MKRRKKIGGPLETKKYLPKFAGLEINPADPKKPDEENKTETIVLDKWVRHDFPDMGFTSYDEVDPPWTMEKEKYKFNLILTEGAKEQLEQLQKRTGAASFAEIIRRSLAVYDALQEHTSAGWELILREKAGKKTEKPVLLV